MSQPTSLLKRSCSVWILHWMWFEEFLLLIDEWVNGSYDETEDLVMSCVMLVLGLVLRLAQGLLLGLVLVLALALAQ